MTDMSPTIEQITQAFRMGLLNQDEATKYIKEVLDLVMKRLYNE